jgi:TonB-linked SusC/RagA family outer membrane protein
MKYIKIIFFLCVFFTLFTQKTSAQNNKINVAAVVVDAQGKLITGAVITNDKDGVKTISNQSGEFTIAVPANSLLSVKAVGYETYLGAPRAELKSITLKSKQTDLVQVAFNSVDRADLLGGVSTKDIVPLLESNFYTGSLDNLSSYIPGYNNTIWGQNGQLVLVDGVPRDQYNVIPSEIDQITVLKSAAAVALYGSRAAKGVVSITTKRGVKNDNKFKVRLNTGISTPKRYAQYLNSADYLTLQNEAITNDGSTIGITTQADIDKYRSGKYPIRYPNIDFYSSDYLKNYTTRNEVTAEYTGGNDRAKFYVNVGTYNTSTLMNYGNAKGEGENRFNLRANLDIKLNDFITSKINSSLTFYDNKSGNTATNNPNNAFWANAATYRPNQLSPFIPLSYLTGANQATQDLIKSAGLIIDGKYLLNGTTNYPTNTFADLTIKGYNLGTTRKYQFDASLNFNLSSLLKGLTFDTQFAIDYNTSYATTTGDNTYAYYTPTTWASDSTISVLTKTNTDNIQYSRNIFNSYQQQTLFFSGAFKYKNTFDKVHNVSALLLAHAYKQQESQVYHATAANANLGLQVGYNYKQKYYVDFTGNVVHSARLAAGNRDEFSPTVSLGWTLSNEDFLAKSDVVNFLKLTASAGIIKTDLDFTGGNYNGYYLYQGSFSNSLNRGWSWQENRGLTETNVVGGDNFDLVYEQRKEISLGFEASLFNNSLQVSGSYYNNLITGIPVSNVNLFPNFMQIITLNPTTIITSFIPYVNYNEDQRQGFDLGINYNKKVGQVDLSVGAVVSYYDTKATLRNDVNIADAYQKTQGKPLDAIWGLKSTGFYDATSIAAINSSPANPKPSWGVVQPGDLKYVDQNADGIIDDKDNVYLGKGGNWGSPLTLALNFTAKWNNFTLFVLANSYSGSYGLKNSSYYWAYGVNAKYSAPMLGRWTPATAATATYPRLTQTGGSNNFRNSDFWLYKSDRLNLARVQLSYDIPRKLLAKTFISDLGIYINGNDLLTIAQEQAHMETNIGSAPQMRYYSVGLKVAF